MTELNDEWEAMNELLEELGPAERLLGKAPVPVEALRAYFRWIFAMLEAFTFCLKRLTLDQAARAGTELSPREPQVLTTVKEPTFPGLAPRWIESGMRESFGVALNVYARARPRESPLQNGRMPDAFFDGCMLHDRLTHPESPEDLDLDKIDLAKISAFVKWFATTREWLYRDYLDEHRKRQHEQRRGRHGRRR